MFALGLLCMDNFLSCTATSSSESEPMSPTEETIVTRRHSTVRSERREKITEEFKKVEVDLSLKVPKQKTVRERMSFDKCLLLI